VAAAPKPYSSVGLYDDSILRATERAYTRSWLNLTIDDLRPPRFLGLPCRFGPRRALNSTEEGFYQWNTRRPFGGG
jgi:hypothetical protein